ncbi:MAG: hypothetical protein QNJ54_23735 [Prochloraceae cyanobacterium]|nr:hypothetical protein [Prochloraceae cyanobacterium]
MTQQHYRLTLSEAIAHYNDGLITASGLLYFYLKIRLAPRWKCTLHQREISSKLGISRTAFYKAIAKLSEKRLIEFETPNGITVTLSTIEDSSTQSETPVHDRGLESPIEDSSTQSETPVHDRGLESPIEDSSTQSETSSTRSKTPSTRSETPTPPRPPANKTSSPPSDSYQIFIKSLSEDEREKFLFVIESLPYDERKKFLSAIKSVSDGQRKKISSHSTKSLSDISEEEREKFLSVTQSVSDSEREKSLSVTKPIKKPAPQTYCQFIKGLSTEEREKFFNFVRQKTKNFNPVIVCLDDYLASKDRWQGLYKEFRFVICSATKSHMKQKRRANSLAAKIDRMREQALKAQEQEEINKEVANNAVLTPDR